MPTPTWIRLPTDMDILVYSEHAALANAPMDTTSMELLNGPVSSADNTMIELSLGYWMHPLSLDLLRDTTAVSPTTPSS